MGLTIDTLEARERSPQAQSHLKSKKKGPKPISRNTCDRTIEQISGTPSTLLNGILAGLGAMKQTSQMPRLTIPSTHTVNSPARRCGPASISSPFCKLRRTAIRSDVCWQTRPGRRSCLVPRPRFTTVTGMSIAPHSVRFGLSTCFGATY